MERRHTVQKELVLNAVRSMRSHVTADEVYNYIVNEHPSVSKGTVYRNLNLLAEEGEIKKVEIPESSDRYDFTTEEHYHIVCLGCGDVFDVDMAALPDLKTKIRDCHGMDFLGYDILFRGLCPSCKKA